MPELEGLNLTAATLVTILWIIWLMATLVFVVASVIFIYHWRRYGWHTRATGQAEVIYLLGGSLLLAAAAGVIFLL